MSSPLLSASARFVLVNTSHRGNVGAVARAMRVMGFHDLVLVAPRFDDALTHPDALAMASGAADVLQAARVVPTWSDAMDGVTHVCATAMTPRDFGPPTHNPRSYLSTLAKRLGGLASRAAGPVKVGFVFGSERFGMSNDDVYRCHVCLSIPTATDYGSLNLAQAVQVIAYEWRQALLADAEAVVAPPKPDLSATVADVQSIEGLIEHWREALIHLGYLDPAVPRRLMPRLQQLLLRQGLSPEEVHILRGIARSVLRTTGSSERR